MKLKYPLIFSFMILFWFFSLKYIGENEQISLTEVPQIYIPGISLSTSICQSGRQLCLDSGIWLKYSDEKGNVLLTGHSFFLLPFSAGVFYGLSDIEVGEKIYISLEEALIYEVYEVFVTSRYDLEVENFDNSEKTLVLYSCYPLWTASKRIVVRARLCNFCEYEI